MNKTQLQNTLAPIVSFAAGWLAGKFPALGLQGWTEILMYVAGLIATLWGVWASKPSSLTDTVGNMPGTTVVTTPEMAAALPANDSVVSTGTNRVVPK